MRVVHSEKTKQRQARTELAGGRLVAPFECPERIDRIVDSLRERAIGAFSTPASYGLGPIEAVHDRDYIDFMARVWADWQAAGFDGEVIPSIWPTRRTRADVVPRHIEGRVGYYALAGETSIEAHTYDAARVSVDIALSALAIVQSGEPAAFGLCRPPGHHAAADQFGGYCFFNNAAIAAQRALDDGAQRVAILDVDFHHGNGTQDIFYRRDDVLFVSLHGDPADEFPYFLGHADETGEDAGRGLTVNYPMAPGTGYRAWASALDAGLARIADYAPDLLIVSLGVDTYKADPISSFTLDTTDFRAYGARIARAGLPTLFLMEGGYAVAEIGHNVAAVLGGFDEVGGT